MTKLGTDVFSESTDVNSLLANIDPRVTALETLQDRTNPADLATALSDTRLVVGDVLTLKDNSNMWDTVPTGTFPVGVDIFDVFEHANLPLQLKLRISMGIITFRTKTELAAANYLVQGNIVKTLKHATDSSGGGANYDIVDGPTFGVPDGDVNFYVGGGTDFVAVQEISLNLLDVATAGVRCKGQDDTVILQKLINYCQTNDINITGAGETVISSLIAANSVNIYFRRLKITLIDDFPDTVGFAFVGSDLGSPREFIGYFDGNRDNQTVQTSIELCRVNGVSNPLSNYDIKVANAHIGYTITGAAEKSRHIVHGFQCDLLCQLIDGTGTGDQSPDESHIQIYGSNCGRYFFNSGLNSATINFMVEQQEIAQSPVLLEGTKTITISGEIRGTRGAVTVNNVNCRVIFNSLMMQSTQSADADWLIDIQAADTIMGSLIGDNPGVGKLRVNQLEAGGDMTIIDSGDPTIAAELGGASTCKRLTLRLNSNGALNLVNTAEAKIFCAKAPSSITVSGSEDWFIQAPQSFMANNNVFTNNGSQSGILEIMANMSSSEIQAYSFPERSMVVTHCRDRQGRPAQYTAVGTSGGWQTWSAIDI